MSSASTLTLAPPSLLTPNVNIPLFISPSDVYYEFMKMNTADNSSSVQQQEDLSVAISVSNNVHIMAFGDRKLAFDWKASSSMGMY